MTLSNYAAKKSAARLAAIQYLYALEIDQGFQRRQLEQDLLSYYQNQEDQEKINSPDKKFLNKLISLAVPNMVFLDEKITEFSARTSSLDKISLVLKSILRCGICEILYMSNVPTKVIINEYTTITSSFFDQGETGFVNSMLDKIAISSRKIYSS